MWPLVDCASASATTGVRPLSEEKTGTLETTAGATLLTNIAELKAEGWRSGGFAVGLGLFLGPGREDMETFGDAERSEAKHFGLGW